MSDAEKLLAGKYELYECLGAGGTGNVYRAVQRPLDRIVALKLLKRSLGRDRGVRRRFAREARAVASLNHPNITTIYDFGLADGDTLFLAMEYIDGRDLRALIDEGLPTIPSLLICEQLLAGLAHAHARGLIHRDLKPANILVSQVDGRLRVKIVDFGLAAAAGARDTGDKRPTVIGTPAYMAPEQAQGDRQLTPAVDLYNVGLMLYELTTGRHPFQAQTPHAMMLQHCSAPVPRPLPRPGFLLPKLLERAILRCLNKQPGQRHRSAAELSAELAEVRQSLEDTGHIVYLPVAPILRDDTEGRITLVEGSPRVVARGELGVLSPSQAVPFVGRDEERRFLLECRDHACSGRGAIILLEGETGIGKTRLATWFKEETVEGGSMRALAGRYLREGDGDARGLREALEQLFGTRGLSTAEASKRVVSQLVTWQLTDAKDAGLLIEMLRPPERPANGDGGQELQQASGAQQALRAACVRVLEAAAAQQPLLLILDDLQWSKPQTCEFFSYLCGEMSRRTIPILVVATLRSEDLAFNTGLSNTIATLAVREHDVFFRRRLGRMRNEGMQLLIQHVLPAHESLVRDLLNRADGNPLYLLQILRYLVDEGLIVRTETGTYMAAEDVKVAETIPPNLADLLLVQLLQMDRRHQDRWPLLQVLERAAILGSRLPFEGLVDVITHDFELNPSGDEPIWLDDAVDALVDEGLLTSSPGQREDLLDFGSNLVRDVLLKRLAPRRATRRLHLLAAEAKRRYFSENVEVVAQQLSAHFELAYQFQEALEYAYLAGVTAEKMHRPADATAAWRRFLRLFSRVPAEKRDSLRLPMVDEVQARLGELQESLGLYEKAERTFRQLLDTDQVEIRSVNQLRAILGLATIALKRGQEQSATTRFQRARQAAQDQQEATLGAVALLGLARVNWHRGEADSALVLAADARDEFLAQNDPRGEANALWFTGDVNRLLGRLDASCVLFEAALHVFERLEDSREVARCLYGMALIARSRDDLDLAESLYQRAYYQLEPLGVRRGLAHCLNGLGEVARFRSRLDQARDFYREAVELYQGAGLSIDAAVSLTNLGLVARDSGDLDGARDAMERALRVAEASNYSYLTVGIAFNLGWVYALLGQHELSAKLLDIYLEKARLHGLVDPDFALPLEGIASVLDAAGDSDKAKRLRTHAKSMWEELRRDRDAERVRVLLR